MVPQPALSAKAAAYKRRDHLNIFRSEPEDQRQGASRGIDRLRGFQHGQRAVVIPNRDGRVRLDGVVVVPRREVDVIDPHIRLLDSFFDVPDLNARPARP